MNIIENPTEEFERQFVKAINARRKLKGNKPKFVIMSEGTASSNENQDEEKVLLTVKSIQTFLLSCLDKCPRSYSASWCKILRVQKLQQVFVICLNGVDEDLYNRWIETEYFQYWKDLFTSEDICHHFRFHTQKNLSLIKQFSRIAAKTRTTGQISDSSLLKAKAEQLSRADEPEKTAKRWKKTVEDQFSRVELVLSLKQIIAGNYPCPIYNTFPNFKELKSSYKAVHSSSKILALDVETFEDSEKSRQVPYWLSIVDENLNCVYQTLIRSEDAKHQELYLQKEKKVRSSIPDITEKSLDQVHQDLKELFDDDLILAGHSLENDLKYLQFYYPYIIDTSIIYNITGSRLEKSSLQKLYAVFFGRLIQKIRFEHDPTEDARATMELIQLKLSKNVEFGDWFLGGVDQMKVLGHYDSVKLDEDIDQCQSFVAQTKFGLQEDFFKKIKDKQNVLMIEQNCDEIKVEIPRVEVQSNREALKTCLEQLPSKDFLWLQLYFSSSDDEKQFSKTKKYFRKFYQSLREDSIIIGFLSGQTEFSRCFVRIKDEDKFQPLLIEGKEYPFNLKLVKTS